jgi:hypothetical protein
MELFSKKSFKGAMSEYAEEIGWEISELNQDSAVLEFETESGLVHTLYLTLKGNMLVFSVPAALLIESEADIPDDVSTLLLKRNADLEIGFWALEESEEGWTFMLYHEQQLPNQDFEIDLDAVTFRGIVEAMIVECDELDRLAE